MALSTAIALGRTKAWNHEDLYKTRRVQNYALRRVFGMDPFRMQELHIKDEDMRIAAAWESSDTIIKRQALLWLGHAARMKVERWHRMALFGWREGHNKRQNAK